MYQVSIFNGAEETIIHYPTTENGSPHLLKDELQLKLGKVHNLNFTIPITNDGYDKVFDFITLVKVTNTINEDIIFEGRVFTSVENMSAGGEFYKEVIAESELSYLNDSITRAWNIDNMGVLNFITKVINNHNAHTTADKQFAVGRIQVVGNITCTTKFENSLNSLIDKMVNTLEVGYLIVRKEDGIRYLDYLPQVVGVSANIDLGINMKDICFSKDVTSVATILVPTGKDNLTIESVNGGKDYLEDIAAVAEFGAIEQPLELSEITDANILKATGQAKLNNISKAIYKLSTNVLDLNVLGLDPNSYHIGTDTTITNSAIKFLQTFTILEKNIDLLNPQNSTLTLNNKFETATDRQISLERVSKYVEKILTSDKQLNTFYLDGYINTLKNQVVASGAYANAQVIEDKGILLENTDINSVDYGALYLGPGIFAIAKEKTNGTWDYRTFGTGKGFTADLMIAGTLDAGIVNVINLIADNIVSGTINANIINLINLNASNINVGTLNGSIVNVTNLNASNMNVGTLNGNNVNIDNLTANNIHAGTLTVDAQWGGSKGTVSANSNGLSNNYGGSTNAYKSLIAVGTGTINITDGTISMSLPSVFAGKSYSVIVAARSAVGTSGFTLWTNPSSWSGGTFSIVGGMGNGTDSIAFSWVAVA